MLTHPKDTLSDGEQWSIMNSGTALWDNSNRPSGALVLPDTVSHNGIIYTVRAIGAYTFADCPIYSVVMSNTIDSLGDAVFFKCTSLTHFTFSDSLRYVGIDAFFATHLGNVVLPSSVRILKNRAFEDAGITSITLNDSLEVMEGGCFANNWIESRDFYNTFTSLNIPASVRSFSHPDHMGDLTSVTSITVDPNNPYYDSRNNCNAVINSNTDELIYGCRNTIIPSDILILGNEAFRGCGTFDTLVVPNSVLQMHFSDREPSIRKLIISSPSMVIRMSGNPIDTIKVLADTPPFLVINGYDGFNAGRVVVEVPCNSIPAYQAASGWSNFTNYIEDGMQKVTAQQSEHGTVTVVRPTCANPSATFTATADEGYHFAQWSDGDTNNPRIVTVDSDTTLTAIFAINQYTVNAIPNDPEMGNVTGSGISDHGSTITLTATANGGYHFDHWSDNVTDNPRPLTVTRDTTVTAYFVALPVDTLYIHDTTIITDTVIFRYYMYDTTIVNNYQYDTSIYNHFQYDTTLLFDTIIINIYNFDTSIYNTYQYDTIIVNNYYYDTVFVTNYYHDTIIVNNYIYDTIYLNRYIFDTVYIHDTIFVPSGQDGIDEVDAINAKIYQRDGQIVVEGAESNTVWLYDVNGRILATKQDDYAPLHFDVPVSGTYLVKIGNHPARRVVVIR